MVSFMADDPKTIGSVAIEIEAKLGKALEDGLTKIHGEMAGVQELIMKMGKAIGDNLSSPMEGVGKSTKSLIDSVYGVNKMLEVTNTLSKMESNDYNNMVKSLNEAGILEEGHNKLINEMVQARKTANKLEEEASKRKALERVREQEFQVDVRQSIQDIDSLQRGATEEQKKRDKERCDFYKDMAKSTGRVVADFFGLGDIYEKAFSAGKKVKDVLNKLFEPNKATNMMAERALKIRNLINKTDKSGVPIEKLHTKNKLKEFKNEQQLMKDKVKSGKLSKEDVINIKNKAKIEDHISKLKKMRNPAGAGGKPPIPAGGASAAAGGGGGEAAMMASRGAIAGIGVAAAAVAVVVGVVVAGVLLLGKALSTASAVMEEFHTINFEAAGGQRQLAMAIADVTISGDFLVKEVQETTKALAEAGFTTRQLTANNNKLISSVTAYTRVTGISSDVTAKLIKTHMGLGGTMSQTKEQLGAMIIAMRKYGLTAKDAEDILSTINEISSKLSVTMGYSTKQIAGATNAMAQLAGSAKRLGFDASDATGFFKDLTDNAEKFIVATKGKSLFQGPTETLSMLVRDSDKILQNLQKFRPGVIRSQMMNQLYGMNDKQLRMILDLKDQHIKWAENEKKAALSRGESLEKLDLSEKTFLEASKQSKETMDNIDKLAKKSNENVGRQWDLTKAKVEAAFLKFGALIMPIFVTAMDYVIGTFKWVLHNWKFVTQTLLKVLLGPVGLIFSKLIDSEFDSATSKLVALTNEFEEARNAATGFSATLFEQSEDAEQQKFAEEKLASLALQKRNIEKNKSLDDKIKKQQLEKLERETEAANSAIEDIAAGARSFTAQYNKALIEIQKSTEKKDKAASNYIDKMAAAEEAVKSNTDARREQWHKSLREERVPSKTPAPQPMRPTEKDKIDPSGYVMPLHMQNKNDKAQAEREKHTAELQKQNEFAKLSSAALKKISEATNKPSKFFSDSIVWN